MLGEYGPVFCSRSDSTMVKSDLRDILHIYEQNLPTKISFGILGYCSLVANVFLQPNPGFYVYAVPVF